MFASMFSIPRLCTISSVDKMNNLASYDLLLILLKVLVPVILNCYSAGRSSMSDG
uniref:Uncharacterized protein n=1 Tax=Rhizophora mucronata TaxID=61149 RepID=A0A2P2M3L3_RHIMU